MRALYSSATAPDRGEQHHKIACIYANQSQNISHPSCYLAGAQHSSELSHTEQLLLTHSLMTLAPQQEKEQQHVMLGLHNPFGRTLAPHLTPKANEGSPLVSM